MTNQRSDQKPVKTQVKTQVKKSISAAQRKKDPKAGPHGSFPLDPAHLKAAWDLAGHAANPDAVRAKVIAYARAHGLLGSLPQSAKDHMKKQGSAGISSGVSKASAADMQAVMQHAYHATEAHSFARQHFLHEASVRKLLHLLPEQAHTDLHEFGIRHSHPNMNDGIVPTLGGEDEGDLQSDPDDNAYPLMHEHVITKALSPKATVGRIVKGWEADGAQYIEGWMSTPDRDLEKDITEPEAFKDGPLSDYFARSAPLSLEHGTSSLPAGHLQKAAILRDGRVLETAEHPSDPADFQYLPTAGSGVWVRGVLTEEPAVSAVRKGNVGGMSFIGNFTHYTPLPGGGKRFHKIDPLLESTVAAYPINPKAAFSRVQKALGLSDSGSALQETDMPSEGTNEFDFDAFMQEAFDRVEAQRQADEARVAAEAKVQKGVTQEQLGDMLAQLMAKIEVMVDSKVQKAQIPERGEGVGRKGALPSEPSTEDQLDADPIKYLVQKAASKDGAGYEEFTTREKEVAGALWNAYLSKGMSYE